MDLRRLADRLGLTKQRHGGALTRQIQTLGPHNTPRLAPIETENALTGY